jgi:WD40 repeat protein
MSEAPKDLSNVITFYSYKGGTGRSMALANVAWIIASNGHTVLAIDWDLEAPGLHRYFAPWLADPSLAETDGLIDQLYAYQQATSRPQSEVSVGSDWILQYADVSRYAEPLTWEFPYCGRVDLLSAGRQDRRYGERVNMFDWQAFYGEYGGGAFFESMIEQACDEYDYVLIDSRTGVSDTSGICTVHLPDILAVFYTLNDQSIQGASAVASDALKKRRALDGNLRFRVYPVATRIEDAEKDKLRARLKIAQRAFEPVLDFISNVTERDEYFGSMQLQYEPYYAYEEVLATVIDDPTVRGSLLKSFEVLTGHLTGGQVQKLTPVTETRRLEAKTLYTEMTSPEVLKEKAEEPVRRYDVFVLFDKRDENIASELIRSLRSICYVFDPQRSILPGEDYRKTTNGAFEGARIVLGVISQEPSSFMLDSINRVLDDDRIIVPLWRSRRATQWAAARLPELASRKGICFEDQNNIAEIAESVTGLLGVRPLQKQPLEQGDSTHHYNKSPRARRSWTSTWMWRAAISAIVLLTLYGVFTELAPITRNEQGQSTFLASAAIQVRDTDPVQSLLLARAAVMADSNDFAVTTLRGSLRASPEIRRFMGLGPAFIAVASHVQSDYVIATDVVGESFIFQANNPLGDFARIGRTREVAWGPVDRMGRPSVLAVLLDGSVTRWTPLDGNVTLLKMPTSDSPDVAFGPRGELLLQLESEGNLRIWDLRKREPVLEIKGAVALPPDPWSGDGRKFVVFDSDNSFTVWGVGGERRYSPNPSVDASAIRDVLLNHDGSRMLLVAGRATAVYSKDHAIVLNEEVQTPPITRANIRSANVRQTTAQRLNRIEQRSVVNALAPTAADWGPIDVVGGIKVEPEDIVDQPIEAIAFGYDDGSTAMWLISRGGQTLAYTEYGAGNAGVTITQVQFAPQGDRFLATGGTQMSVYSTASSSNQQVTQGGRAEPPGVVVLSGHEGRINDADWGGASPSIIASASQDGTVRIWDPDTSTLSLDMPAEELLRLAESRLPRRFTEAEASDFGVDFENVQQPTMFEAVPEQGLLETSE